MTFTLYRCRWHATLYLKATYLPSVTPLPEMSNTLLFCTYSCLEMNLPHLTLCPLVFCNGPTCRHNLLGEFLTTVVLAQVYASEQPWHFASFLLRAIALPRRSFLEIDTMGKHTRLRVLEAAGEGPPIYFSTAREMQRHSGIDCGQLVSLRQRSLSFTKIGGASPVH